ESASVAHIYGQNIAAAESMTAWGKTAYSYCPENLKEIADIELAEGINRFVIHESAHQPVDDKVPGLSLGGIGQWFNRHDTWAEQAVAWVDYMSRSCYMLQQGKNLADVLVYYGEDDNITSLYGGGAPSVPAGYQFDYCSANALGLMTFKEGKITSSASGTAYQLLWLDKNVDYMSLDVLKKIAELAKAGALIGGEKPKHPYSLTESQQEFDALVAEIWDSHRSNVTTGIAMEEVLKNAGIEADLQTEEGVKYLHRTLPDAEIYWLNRPAPEGKTLQASFRVTGRVPQIWHPETGKIEAASYKMEGGRTTVTVPMAPNDAVFVVFGVKAEQMELRLPEKVEDTLLTIETPWTVRFQEKRGAPAETTFEKLVSYTESSEFGIKYFSGTASYLNTVQVGKTEGQVILDLGAVKNLAEVI
ncbi:MAG: glycoside hydrolase, partial [Bacteroidaceae bacterium]|nr:glycoside hydrolase [Bacteroidaceae bacterium]